jgi:hypothetical protein
MSTQITSEIIASFKTPLENHPIYQAVSSMQDLRCFMQHHIYSVWDFMSLLKYLQSVIAPAGSPWVPHAEGDVRRFVNELVLEEESDETPVVGEYASHYELYHQAMGEVGADASISKRFVQTVQQQGIDKAFELIDIPAPSREFTSTTFSFIRNNKPHQVAAALALGREHIIPCMFRSILAQSGISQKDAPIFHFYLERHIHLDEGFHAPLSLKLLNSLCDNDDTKTEEAIETAKQAVNARLRLWDGVLETINSAK